MNKLRQAAQAVVDMYHGRRELGLGPIGAKVYVPECVAELREALDEPKMKKFIKEKPMEVTVTLLEEQISQIVIDELKNSISILEMELDNRNSNANSFGVFHNDKEKDIVEIENHLLALKTTLDWFEPSWMKNNENQI